MGKKVLEAFNKNPVEALVFANGNINQPYAAFVSPNRGIFGCAPRIRAIGVVNPEPAKELESLFTPGLEEGLHLII